MTSRAPAPLQKKLLEDQEDRQAFLQSHPNGDKIGKGWLKKLKKGSTFEKKFFIVDGDTIKHFSENNETCCVSAPEAPLSSLVEVRVPSTAAGAAGQGFDLVFTDMEMTMVEDDTPDSRRFSMMVKKLHPRPREAGVLTTKDGETMLVIECESCGTLQAIQANAKRAKCIECKSKLDMSKAARPEEIELNTVQCGWCNQWLQYPSTAPEVQCANCRNVLNLRDKGSEAVEDGGGGEGLEKYKKMVARLNKEIAVKDRKLADYEQQIMDLKKEVELLQGGGAATARRVTTRKKKPRAFGGGGAFGADGELDDSGADAGAAAEVGSDLGVDVSAITGAAEEEEEHEAEVAEQHEEEAAAEEEFVEGHAEGEYSSVWEVHTDEEGQVFYHNPETDETEWEPPMSIIREGFVKHVDDDTGDEFYHNDATDASEWEPPLIPGLKHVGPDDE